MKPIFLDKWSKLALYQEKLSDGSVRCLLCPHNCLLGVEKQGICKVRANFQGQLYTTVFGNPCTLNIDPIEKKPLFHFLPSTEIYSIATVGCNLHCSNCQNAAISQSASQDLFHYNLMPKELIQQVLNHKVPSIAFTYTEPTVFYEYMYEAAVLAHQHNLKTVMVSNGFINQKPLLDLCPYLDAANIDLKCFDDLVYRQLTGGRLQPVLDTLKTLKAEGVWLEITNLLVPTYSDIPQMIWKMCQWLVDNGFRNTPIHFTRFYPSHKLYYLKPTTEEIMLQAKVIAENAGMKYVYIGNFPLLASENTYCTTCKRMLVERNGYIVQNEFVINGKCPFCNDEIEGVWA